MNTKMPLFIKRVIEHPTIYIVAYTKAIELPYIIFVHGGPGLNSGVLGHLIEHKEVFDSLEFNIVLYDQRGCGRSQKVNETVLHADNVNDLEEVYKTLVDQAHFNVAAIAGHSYGAKLLFDYLQCYQKTIPSIFIATASSMLTPRINNLLLDFAYLKSVDKTEYQKVLEDFSDYRPEMLWKLTERLAKVFQENNMRSYFYWANLDWKEKVFEIQEEITLPINTEVFKSVRQDIYTQADSLSVDVGRILKSPFLWVNGFHDLIMNGASAFTDEVSPVKLFFKSAHYPHIEEYGRFCEEVNNFLNSTSLL